MIVKKLNKLLKNLTNSIFGNFGASCRACLGLTTNVARPKHPPDRTHSPKGCGGRRLERAKTGECDSKKFFFVKFSRSVYADVVGIALRGRVADEVLVVENM